MEIDGPFDKDRKFNWHKWVKVQINPIINLFSKGDNFYVNKILDAARQRQNV